MGSKKIQLFLFKIITVFLDWVFPPLTLISAAESDPCLAAHSTISNFWSQLGCGGGNFRHHFYILVSTALWGFLLYSVSMARYNGWLIEPACVVSFLRLLNSVRNIFHDLSGLPSNSHPLCYQGQTASFQSSWLYLLIFVLRVLEDNPMTN